MHSLSDHTIFWFVKDISKKHLLLQPNKYVIL